MQKIASVRPTENFSKFGELERGGERCCYTHLARVARMRSETINHEKEVAAAAAASAVAVAFLPWKQLRPRRRTYDDAFSHQLLILSYIV